MNEVGLYDVISSFRAISHALYGALRDYSEAAGLSYGQALVLFALAKSEGIGLTDLAEALVTSTSAASTTVEQLVQMGLISRERSVTDRRQIILTLTKDGQVKKGEVFEPLQKQLSVLLQIPNPELARMLETHKRILGLLGQA